MVASSGEVAVDAIFVVAIALFIGFCLAALKRFIPVPYTVLLLVFGLAIGIGGETYVDAWNFIGPGIHAIKDLQPAFLALLFLPPLLFAGAFGLDSKTLLQSWSHIVLLGIVGVGTGTCMTAVLTYFILPYPWSWLEAMLYGAIVAATDPVSAVAVLREVNAPQDVQVVVDGEALVDDGIAAVLFAAFQALFLVIMLPEAQLVNLRKIFVSGGSSSAGGVVRLLCRQSLGGPATGLAFGTCITALLYVTPQDANLLSVMLLGGTFGAFFVSEEIFHASGILASVALGMLLTVVSSKLPRFKLKETVEGVWSAIEYVANTIVFIVSGIIIAARIYNMHQEQSPWRPDKAAYGYAVLVWVLLFVVRTVNLLIFWPILVRTGHGFSFTMAALTAWSGIRGVVGLVLALYVLVDSSIPHEAYSTQVFFFLASTVVLTVVLQGTTYATLAKALGVGCQTQETLPETTERNLEGPSVPSC